MTEPRDEPNFRDGLDNANDGGRFRGVGCEKTASFNSFISRSINHFSLYEEKKKMKKSDKNSHHQKNYLVIFGDSKTDLLKCLVNASDEKNGLRIALNHLCKKYPEKKITRARIGGGFLNEKRIIKKRIGSGI